MLSVIDLIDAGTMDRNMAAYLLAVIGKGKSFLVGSKTGGSGKTTVMAALLNFIPDVEILPAESDEIIKNGLFDKTRRCYLAHEIGDGSYYAYISGESVKGFLDLTSNHMVASNLHADNIDEVLAHDGIDSKNLANIDVLIFMKLVGNIALKRRINYVYENQGGQNVQEAFKLIFKWNEKKDAFEMVNDSKVVNEKEIKADLKIINQMINNKIRTIEEVRIFIQN